MLCFLELLLRQSSPNCDRDGLFSFVFPFLFLFLFRSLALLAVSVFFFFFFLRHRLGFWTDFVYFDTIWCRSSHRINDLRYFEAGDNLSINSDKPRGMTVIR